MLRTCELAVFVIWKRWGSPTGTYSSGFEEEFELANSLHDNNNRCPEIFLYFRDIPDDIITSPDEQLRKVLGFRSKIEGENKLLYHKYETPREWEGLFRSHVSQWIMRKFASRYSVQQVVVKKEKEAAEVRFEPAPVATSRPQWTIVDTPDTIPSFTKELLNPNNQGIGINKVAIAPDGATVWAIVRRGDRNGINQGGAQVMLYRSTDGGISWTDAEYLKLVAAQSRIENGTFIWDLAIAPDDPNIVVVACADISLDPLLQQVWISTDKGSTWENTKWPPLDIIAGTDLISAIDISADFGNRIVLIGTRDGSGLDTNNLQIMKSDWPGHWNSQNANSNIPTSINYFTGDILTAKFSPNFPSDHTVVLVYCDGTSDHKGTWLVTGIHDIHQNTTIWQKQIDHVEIKNANGNPGDSPGVDEIIIANLELPSDFSGDYADQRCFYVSTDAIDRVPGKTPNRGVYRINNKVPYTLMDSTAAFGLVGTNKITKRVASIAYFGTCSSGKLLVGEVLGNGNQATVLSWFTDSPEVYPIPCWYPALKPTTGGAGQPTSRTGYTSGYGNAKVVWSPDGILAYAATGAASLGPWATPATANGAVNVATEWPAGYVNVIPFDESAFGISRSNGETWNQLSLINTLMSKLTDVAPSADGETIYLASVNTNPGSQGFDSVWRSSSNPAITAPLPPMPIGTYWERVLTRVTAVSCNETQTDLSILRLAGGCYEPTGQIVGWAAQGTKAEAWSPDYGDYWENITARNNIQDFAFESSTILYNLYTNGTVQKLPYTGTAWSTTLPSVNPGFPFAHMIAAMPEGQVLVGYNSNASPYPVVISKDGGTNFIPLMQPLAAGNIHVAFDPAYNYNNIVYLGGEAGSVYRANVAGAPLIARWVDTDMLAMTNGAIGCPDTTVVGGIFGLALAYIGGALYASDGGVAAGVWRTLSPLDGIPKPGIRWECLRTFTQVNGKGIQFTTEPSSLRCCGGLIIGMKITLYAIDNNCYANKHNASTSFGGIKAVRECGMLWAFTDDVARNP